MYSKLHISEIAFVAAVLLLLYGIVSCSPVAKLRRAIDAGVLPDIAVNDERECNDDVYDDECESAEKSSDTLQIVAAKDEPIIMNAIRDSETGEMIATDVIRASKVTARFNHVAERLGNVTIAFDIQVPSAVFNTDCQLRFKPRLYIQQDSIELDEIRLTGDKYRNAQLRGYERYRNFLSSILTDTADWVILRQLEVFIARNYPKTYAMRNDSSIVPEPSALSLFGVSQKEALMYYSQTLRHSINDRKLRNRDKVFARYVKDPLPKSGVILDTVIKTLDGDFVYTCHYSFKSRKNLKKVFLNVDATVYSDGRKICDFPEFEPLTYYISSLSSLADKTTKYLLKINTRVVRDNTIALIDFEQGKAVIDTSLSDNAKELARMERCIEDVFARELLVLDSLVITASCSPEGSYRSNERLSAARSAAVRDYLSKNMEQSFEINLDNEFVQPSPSASALRHRRHWTDTLLKVSSLPENWAKLETMVIHDHHLSTDAKDRILLLLSSESNPDTRESKLSKIPEYRYLREKIYPSLRCVKFDFHLHRRGMVKDTLYTTEIDSTYMAGLAALENLDYPRAVELLRAYADYNSALAYLSSSYNHSALEVLNSLENKDARVWYLMAVAYARLSRIKEARESLTKSISLEARMRHRANLDPELSELVVNLTL